MVKPAVSLGYNSTGTRLGGADLAVRAVARRVMFFVPDPQTAHHQSENDGAEGIDGEREVRGEGDDVGIDGTVHGSSPCFREHKPGWRGPAVRSLTPHAPEPLGP